MVSCAVKQPSLYSNGFQIFPEAIACGKILSHDSVSRGTPVYTTGTGELKITVDRSICVTFVYHLGFTFFCSSKL